MPHCVLLRHAIHARPETLSVSQSLDSDYTSISDEYRQLFIEHCQNGHSFPDDEIIAIDCQFSRLVGTPMAVLCNASTSGGTGSMKNARASRLTTDVSTGKHTLVHGNVLVVPVAKKNSDSSSGVDAGHVEEVDNAIHDEVLEYFCQGLKPQPKDIQRIVKEFLSGKFKYTAYHHEEKKEEEALPGWG